MRGKGMGLFFGAITAFYFGYFIWSFFYDGTTIFQLIQRGSSIFIFAYITYAIHSQNAAKLMRDKDAGLYSAVDQMRQIATPGDIDRIINPK